jgi:hypothetical protein
MLDGRASLSSPAFLACMLQMPITFFPLVPTPQSAIFITYANVDIDEYKKRIFGYVIKKLAFSFILRNPWLKYNNVCWNLIGQ